MVKADDRNHYQAFDDLLGKETNESDMPSNTNISLTKVAEEVQVHACYLRFPKLKFVDVNYHPSISSTRATKNLLTII